MRLFSLLLVCALLIGGWTLWNYNPSFLNLASEYINNGEFLTLEARFSPEQIMESHKGDLLVDDKRTFDAPSLKFHPYVLLEVKYLSHDKKTKEGILLWSLLDGEIVINTETWEKTHGFSDAIKAGATRNEFRILNILSKHGGALSLENLSKELHLESEVFAPWVESSRDKQLITTKGDLIQLHFQDPKIWVVPQTKVTRPLVTKPYNHAQKVNGKFSLSQIEKIATAAFGSEFTIRSATTIYLPVYRIQVINPDGSKLTSFWNSLNGQKIETRYTIL